jgi:NDP-sugar pyrophosphorylase family protein
LSNVVIIIAGGKGLRLDPFTRILPKPLIPINNEPIIKKIMNEFANFGMKNFYITLGDRAKMVKGYFHDHNLPFSIKYSEESKPLGTAGSLSFFNNKFENPVFVTNCDVILKTNYNEILEFHKKNKNDLTIVASMKHVVVPYGICKITKRGNLINITEKPEYDFLANTGFYIMEPKTLSLVPKNRYIDMHNLIKILNNKKRKIGVYPVPSNSWSDVGNWSEYNKSLPRIAAELQKD